ncbi:hypothetical protein JMJ78_0008494 [Colletotrichum scovillei]|nr:hypothetical protein JMJ78_0008494 [Colletotrichum scovillei]
MQGERHAANQIISRAPETRPWLTPGLLALSPTVTGRHITRHRPRKRWEKQHRLIDSAAVKVHSVDGTYRAVPSRSLTAPRTPHDVTLLTPGDDERR